MRLAPWVLAMSVLVSASSHAATYDDLVALFNDWRKFEAAPMRDGAPEGDRSEVLADPAAGGLRARAGRDERLRFLRARAQAVGTRSGLVQHRVDGAERYAGARRADPSRSRRAVDLRVPAVSRCAE